MNLSDIELIPGEIRVLSLGLSFTPTPQNDIHNLEKDIFLFTRKLRLKYHFCDNRKTDSSLVKLPSNFTPKRGTDTELENALKSIERMYVTSKKAKDNISSNRKDLKSLIEKTKSNKIIIKPADKGAIIVIQSPEDYNKMCLKHLNDTEYYEIVQDDPSNLVQQRVLSYAKQYANILTENEYNYLTARTHKLSNFYTLPKLHKNKELNNILLKSDKEYIKVKLETDIEGRPINSGPIYHTSGISTMLHTILLPCLDNIKHILKDSFAFIEKVDKSANSDTQLVTWDIKSLYTNIRHDLFYTAVSYWIDKYGNSLHYSLVLISNLF